MPRFVVDDQPAALGDVSKDRLVPRPPPHAGNGRDERWAHDHIGRTVACHLVADGDASVLDMLCLWLGEPP
jgi:hypothetical protein